LKKNFSPGKLTPNPSAHFKLPSNNEAHGFVFLRQKALDPREL